MKRKQRDQIVKEIQAHVSDLSRYQRRELASRLGLKNAVSVTHHEVIAGLSDQTLTELVAFFELDVVERDPHWPEPGIRIFVSHVSSAKGKFEKLKERCSYFGINLFLAHDNIEEGKVWRESLLSALGTMDAMLTVHSVGFTKSVWTGQEIGYALCRNVPIISVKDGEDPCGFLQDKQGFRWKEGEEVAFANKIIGELSKSDAAGKLAEGLARQLNAVGSFNHSDGVVGALRSCTTITDEAARQINLAFRYNDQVYNSGAEKPLRELLEKFGHKLNDISPPREGLGLDDL